MNVYAHILKESVCLSPCMCVCVHLTLSFAFSPLPLLDIIVNRCAAYFIKVKGYGQMSSDPAFFCQGYELVVTPSSGPEFMGKNWIYEYSIIYET